MDGNFITKKQIICFIEIKGSRTFIDGFQSQKHDTNLMIYNQISLMCLSYSAVRNAGIASTGEQCLGQQWGQLGVASAAHPYVARGYKGAP